MLPASLPMSSLLPSWCLSLLKKTQNPNNSIWFCPYTHWSMVKFLVVRSPREEESFFAYIQTSTEESHEVAREGKGQISNVSILLPVCSAVSMWETGPETSTDPWLYQDHQATNGPQQLHSPHVSTWPQRAHISMLLTTPQKTKPKISPRHQAVVQTACVCPHGSQASLQPGTAAWTTVTIMASGGIMDQDDPAKKL